MLRQRVRRIIKKGHQVKSQVTDSKEEKVQNLENKKTEVNKTRLDLLDTICRNVKSAKQQLPVISSITEMTRYALNASASLLLLLDEENEELLYKFDDGPLGKEFVQLQMNKQLGIARWVIQNGKPLIVKDISKDERFNKFKDEAGLVTRSVICAPLVIHGAVIGVLKCSINWMGMISASMICLPW